MPWQIERSYGRYALVDMAIAAERLVATTVLLVTHQPVLAAMFLSVGSTISLLIASMARPKLSIASGYGLLATLKSCLPYSVATTTSSVYSQIPAVLVGIVAGVGSAALLGFVTRLTQPTEIAAGAISTVGIQRLCASSEPEERRLLARRFTAAAFTAGIACALVTFVCAGRLARYAGITDPNLRFVVALLAIALVPKFVSYQLVAVTVAAGRIRQRALISSICAGVSVLIVLATARHGAVVVASGILVTEFLLVALLVGFGTVGSEPRAQNEFPFNAAPRRA